MCLKEALNRQVHEESSLKQEGATVPTIPIPLFALLHVFENLVFATFENIKPKLKLIGISYFRHISHNKTCLLVTFCVIFPIREIKS